MKLVEVTMLDGMSDDDKRISFNPYLLKWVQPAQTYGEDGSGLPIVGSKPDKASRIVFKDQSDVRVKESYDEVMSRIEDALDTK